MSACARRRQRDRRGRRAQQQCGRRAGRAARIKNSGKGLKVQIEDGKITVDVIIMVRYGSNVVGVAQQVQDAVTAAVESMTGMGTPVVNVHVSGVAFDK